MITIAIAILAAYIIFSYIAMFIMVGNPFKGSDIGDDVARFFFAMAPFLIPRMLFNQIFNGK